MKICVVMWCDGKTAKKYGCTSYHINKIYCEKHGYDLRFSSKRRHNREDLAWEKLPMVIEHLDNYDYVIWIDADAHFYVDRGPIEDLIKEHKDVQIIFSEDGTCKGFPSELDPSEWLKSSCKVRHPALNTGVFIVKNTSDVKKLLDVWTYDEWLFKQNYPYWEQGVCQKMYELNTCSIRDISVVLPLNVLQNYERFTKHNPYVRHFPSMLKSTHGIKKSFRGYLKQLTIA